MNVTTLIRRAIVVAFVTAAALVGGVAMACATAETPAAGGAAVQSPDGSAMERASHAQAPNAIAWHPSVGSIDDAINW